MSQFVLDCSVAISWCFADETNAEAEAILAGLATDRAVVPSIWFLEIANVLLVAERRQRITESDTLDGRLAAAAKRCGVSLKQVGREGAGGFI